jgi:hypothetical protein
MLLVPVIHETGARARKAADRGSFSATSYSADRSAARCANTDSFRGFHVPFVLDILMICPIVGYGSDWLDCAEKQTDR